MFSLLHFSDISLRPVFDSNVTQNTSQPAKKTDQILLLDLVLKYGNTGKKSNSDKGLRSRDNQY